MRLQNLTIIFVVIMLPIILLISLYISNGLKTIQYQSIYDNGLVSATSDAIYAFETNSAENIYSNNAETKRSIIKSSIKMFEKSLCNTCNISSYNTSEIEEYIPAIVFGMYDGFYMYAPSYNSKTNKYEHSLKSYVYYSETLDDGTIIRYSLDNYVSVSVKIENEYSIKEGYLIDIGINTSIEGTQYKGIAINTEDTDALNYYKDAYEFTNWFLNTAKIYEKLKNGNTADYLNINDNNDPEDQNSAFVKHKREVIKNKIEGVLNSTITAYSNKTWGQNYKMPKLSEYDWEKIYNNISVISFFQGKKIGLTKYNGYCVLNSTNSSEYVNPSLMYFIYNEEYHDIRCDVIANIEGYIKGYRIGSFEKKTIEADDGTQNYQYEHDELACYNCINGALSTSISVYDYIKPSDSDSDTGTSEIKTSYWTSLARERYKVTSQTIANADINGEEGHIYKVTFNANAGNDNSVTNMPEDITINISNEEKCTLREIDVPERNGYDFKGWSTNPNDTNGKYTIEIIGDTSLYAIWEKKPEKIKISYIAYEKKGDIFKEKTLQTDEIDLTSSTYQIRNISEQINISGYKFIGWEYGNEIKQENTTIDIDKEDIKLYAIFVEDFNITFNAYNYDTNIKLEKYTGEETIYTNINKVRLEYSVNPQEVKIYGRDNTKEITVSLNKKGEDNNYEKTDDYKNENGYYIIENENAYRISAEIYGTNIVKNTSTIVIDRTKPKVTEKYRNGRTVRVYVDESYIASVQLKYNSTIINMEYDYCSFDNAIKGYRDFNYSCTVSIAFSLNRKVIVYDKARQ